MKVVDSFWLDNLPEPIVKRPALAGDTQADVAIVGGGFTGLWTAYYLSQLDRSLRIVVLEREFCGFGASGRNGGWCIGELAASIEKYASLGGIDPALRLWRAAFDAVDEVGRVATAERIRCAYHKGGTIRLARNDPQAKRQRDEIEHLHSIGITEDEMRLLTADEARKHVNATEIRSGVFHAASAVIDPARLVRGLADVVERRGVTIAEGTAVTSIDAGKIRTTHGTVSADVIVGATEAYTRDLPGQRRTLVPFYSLMVATEPLAPEIFDEIGLADRPTFADDRYMVIYGQRTEDDRIAFGGRGVPYSFGSRISRAKENQPGSHAAIAGTLLDLFPSVRKVEITHRWGGVLAIPRNWTPAVRFDRSTGLAVAGGYVGEGVAAANLAGRTLADLITGTDTERTHLPWVDATWPSWEPEPFRWIGIRGSRALLGMADSYENRTQREAKLAAKLAGLVRG